MQTESGKPNEIFNESDGEGFNGGVDMLLTAVSDGREVKGTEPSTSPLFSHHDNSPGEGKTPGFAYISGERFLDDNGDNVFEVVQPEILLKEENDEVLGEIYDELLENWEDVGSLAILIAEELLIRHTQKNIPEKINKIVLYGDREERWSENKPFQVFNMQDEMLLDVKEFKDLLIFENSHIIEDLVDELHELANKLFAENNKGEMVYIIRRDGD